MSYKIRALVVAAVAVVGLGIGGSAFALSLPAMSTGSNGGGIKGPALGTLGDTTHGPCVKTLLSLPALHPCEDAQGRVVMKLPALLLVGPKKLPATGANTGDLAAIGTAVLAAGLVLSRRVRLSLAR